MAYLSPYCHLALLSLLTFSSANAPPPQCLNNPLRGDRALRRFTSPRVSAREIVWLISHNFLNFQLLLHHPFPLGEGQPAQSTFMAFLSPFPPLTGTRIPLQSLLKKWEETPFRKCLSSAVSIPPPASPHLGPRAAGAGAAMATPGVLSSPFCPLPGPSVFWLSPGL